MNGSAVTALSYPALSFEVYAPFLLLGLHSQLAVWLNVTAWAVGMVLLFGGLSRPLKPLVIILASVSVYIGYAVGGVTDALFVPFLVLVAKHWDDYPKKHGWGIVWQPLWLGLAMNIKQTPWILVPFLLIGIYHESVALGHHRWALWRPVATYALWTGVFFILPNIPFLWISPIAWLKGILMPLVSATVPSGQGLISLSMFLGWGGGSLTAYTVVSLSVLLGSIVLFAVLYARMKAWAFILPSLALFMATRSFGSYLVMLVPAALMALTTIRPMPVHAWTKTQRGIVIGIGTAMMGTFAWALGTQSPLKLTLMRVHTTGQLATIDQTTVRVTNRSHHVIRPHFTANNGGTLSAFWTPLQGPKVLRPGQTAIFHLAAPNFYAMPPLTGGFQMVAFTQYPKSVSHTASYVPTTWHVALDPNSVNKPVVTGHVLTFHAQLLNQMDRAVHVSGVRVYLGQIIYAQRGLQYGQAIVNNGYAGETPMSAVTNRQGQATFIVRNTSATPDPIYFEANLLNGADFYPYGYSQIVPVRFVK